MYYSKLLAFPSISASTQLPHLFPGEMPSEGLVSLLKAVGVDFPAIEPMLPQISHEGDEGYFSPAHDSGLNRTISTDAHLLNVTFDGDPIDMSAQRNRWVYQACTSVLKDLSKVTAADLLDAKAQNHACNHPQLYSSLMEQLGHIFSKQLKSSNVTGVWPVIKKIMGVTDSTFSSLSFSEIINKAGDAFKENFDETQFTEKSLRHMRSEIEKLKQEFSIHQMHFSPTLVGKVKFEYQGPRSLFIISSALVLNMLRLSANCNVKMSKDSVKDSQFLKEGKQHNRNRSQVVPQMDVESLDANLKALLGGLPDTMKSMNPLQIEYVFPTQQSSLVTITVDSRQSRNDRVEGLQSYQNILMQRHMLMGKYKDADIVRFILSVIKEGSIEGAGSKVLTPKQRQWIYDLTILLFGTECQRNRRSFFYHAVAFDMVLNGKLSLHSLLNDPAISLPGDFGFKENMLHHELQSVIPKPVKKWTTQAVVRVLKDEGFLVDTDPHLKLVAFDNLVLPEGTSYYDVLERCQFPVGIRQVVADIWAARNKVEQDCNTLAATTCLPMVQEHAVTQTNLSTRRMGVTPKEYQGGSDQRHAPRYPTDLERKEMLFFQYFIDTHPTLTVSAKNPNYIIDSTTGDPITEEQLVGLIRAYLDQFYGLELSPVHAR